MKNYREKHILFWLSFCRLFSDWKISLSHFSSFLTVYLLFKCHFVALPKGISPKICILCVCVKIYKRSFEPFCVWIQKRMSFGNFVKDEDAVSLLSDPTPVIAAFSVLATRWDSDGVRHFPNWCDESGLRRPVRQSL